MITIKQAKEEIVFFENEKGFSEETNLYDWIMRFESENKLSVEYNEEDDKWRIRYSRVNRRSELLLDQFDTEEDAENECFSRIILFDFNESILNTAYYISDEECEAQILLRLASKEAIDIEVAEHIFRKMKIVFEERQIIHNNWIAQCTKEHDARKAYLAIAVPEEAATIIIDQEFKSALIWAAEATGSEKRDRMASAMKGLLSRNNIEKINSDFWQVFRILKAKAESIATV